MLQQWGPLREKFWRNWEKSGKIRGNRENPGGNSGEIGKIWENLRKFWEIGGNQGKTQGKWGKIGLNWDKFKKNEEKLEKNWGK